MEQGQRTPLLHRRILFAGESWITHSTHVKGVVTYSGGTYTEGAIALLDTLRAFGAEVTYIPNHLAPERFPRTASKLGDYDAVLLSDIAADSLLLDERCLVQGLRSSNRLKELADYVRGGGSLMMIGGYMSFAGIGGAARYGNSPLSTILPVHVEVHDDRVETPEGVVPTVVQGEHEILSGCGGPWPYLLGYNQLRAKRESTVLMQVGADPLLVVADVGQGRAVAFASDCSPHWASQEFMAWGSYGTFWSNLVSWMSQSSRVGTGAAHSQDGERHG